VSDARGLSLRSSVIAFVLLSGVVAAAAMGLLVLVDPRTQDHWAGRLAEFTAGIRTLFGR